jgi:adenine-specific DNA-methyltransferase
MDDNKERLIKLLIDIFQFENEDLDFGIYKILNYKKKEITQFIEKDLVEKINEELNLLTEEEKNNLLSELEGIKEQLIKLSVEDYENNPEYLAKEQEIKNIELSEELENNIYNHIYAFFSRYYDKGDFISKRRYGRNNKYVIPYNGEETLLYWANNDQYYIKTNENLKKYRFKIPGLNVNFRVLEAEEEKANVKSEEKKFFIISKETPFIYENNELSIYLEFRGLKKEEKKEFKRPNQEKINEYNIEVITENLKNDPKYEKLLKTNDKGKSVLEKHLIRYTARNTHDYFIHKDLDSFLNRELDFYIKNEILDLSDISKLDQSLFNKHITEIKVIKHICTKIIDFLAQIEDFQKKLWEKKKFVLNTDYIISLDRIPEEFYDEILENEKQVEEWNELFSMNIHNKTDLIQDKTLEGEIIKRLPVDTKYFSINFKKSLFHSISSKSDFEEKLDGILIKSENYQALNLILDKFLSKVKCVYIDPPYNTGGSNFIYKNDYRHSSWSTMMENRLDITKEILSEEGVLINAIDDFEVSNLDLILKNKFSEENKLGNLCIEIKPSGRTNDDFLAVSHEYYLFYSNNSKKVKINFFELSKDQKAEYNEEDTISRYKWRDFLRTGGYSTPEERPNSFYPIYFDEINNKISLEKKKNFVEIFPIDSQSNRRVWRKTPPSFKKHLDDGDILIKKNRSLKYKVYIKDRIKEGTRPKSVWIGSKYDAASHGTKLLKKLFTKPVYFDYPKSVNAVMDSLNCVTNNKSGDIIIDYFAGSGTTAHAIMKLNKEQDGNRKLILIEMAPYFETVIIPRIKKLMLTFSWKNGKPEDIDGKGGFFKYHYLEQYEDALENISFSEKTLDEFKDYFVKYMLDFETKDSQTFLNIDHMENPFDYKIKILEDYQQKIVPVDLPETYNYLIGLSVNKILSLENKEDEKRNYLIIEGKTDNQKILIIWRDIRNFDPDKDRDFIEKNFKIEDFDEVHLNGDSLIHDAVLIEENFKKLMNG